MRRRRFQRRRQEEEQDVELNLAPIIDCFVVVITFLLVSASFVSIGAIDTSSTEAAAAAEPQAGTLELSVQLRANRSVLISTSGASSQAFEISPASDAFDLLSLGNKLGELKQAFPSLSSATLNAEGGVPYKEVIRALEKTRDQLPQVYLDPEAAP